jgi:hypothetical protein
LSTLKSNIIFEFVSTAILSLLFFMVSFPPLHHFEFSFLPILFKTLSSSFLLFWKKSILLKSNYVLLLFEKKKWPFLFNMLISPLNLQITWFWVRLIFYFVHYALAYDSSVLLLFNV